jgi:hypothetical protein
MRAYSSPEEKRFEVFPVARIKGHVEKYKN